MWKVKPTSLFNKIMRCSITPAHLIFSQPRPLSQHRTKRSTSYIRSLPQKLHHAQSPLLRKHPAATSTHCRLTETSAQSYLPRRACYYYCGELSPTQCLVELQVRDRLSTQTGPECPAIQASNPLACHFRSGNQHSKRFLKSDAYRIGGSTRLAGSA